MRYGEKYRGVAKAAITAGLSLTLALTGAPCLAIAEEVAAPQTAESADQGGLDNAATAQTSDDEAAATTAQSADAETAAAQTADGEAAANVAPESATTTQADVDAAEGTLELHGTITENLTVNKSLKITAAEGTVMKGMLIINADDVTVSGVHFTLDGTVAPAPGMSGRSISCDGKKGLKVEGSTFDITSGVDQYQAYEDSIVLANGASDATISGNTFNVTVSSKYDQGYTAINLIGNRAGVIDNTTIDNNTFTTTPVDKTNASARSYFVIANGNVTDAGHGVTNLKVTNNTISNGTGKNAVSSQTRGIVFGNVSGATFSGNKFSNIELGVSYSGKYGGPCACDNLDINGNTFDCSWGILLRTDDVAEGQITEAGNTFTEGTTPYNRHSSAAVWQAPDGKLYSSIEGAVKAGATNLKLVRDITGNEDEADAAKVVIPKDADVTIDLAGHKLGAVKGATTVITNNGKLTIVDSVGGGLVNTVADGSTIVNSGTAIIKGGSYVDPSMAQYTEDGYGLFPTKPDGSIFKIDEISNANYKVKTADGDRYFENADDANAYAKEHNVSSDDIKQLKYTVSFDTNGRGTVDSITVKAGESVKLPAVPEVNGYTGAWYNGDEKLGDTFTPQSDITLKAMWTPVAKGNGDASSSSAPTSAPKKAMPQTGDDTSLVAPAALAAAGVAAIGAAVVTRRRNN